MFKPLQLLALLPAVLALAACANKQEQTRVDFQMGERATVGPLTYNVIETGWRSQLGSEFKMRFPEQRFLLVTISVTNGGGREISVPLFTLEDQKGQTYPELDNGEGVDNWFGLLRTLPAAQTQQGRLVFDVPFGSYKLRITDGGEPGLEKVAYIELPLRMDTDTGVDTPMPAAPSRNPGASPSSKR
ncbi:MAG TPA: DUF4352 domain-containing protein [Bryobacteraceae bacterium]|jgi:hypothetical protein|nr:DUF4352 domain-containing protein [Bryobacteraceae bacterium]